MNLVHRYFFKNPGARNRSFLVIVVFILLASIIILGCSSSSPANTPSQLPLQAYNTPSIPSSPTNPDPSPVLPLANPTQEETKKINQELEPTQTDEPEETESPSPTPKPTLGPEDWKNLPVIPTVSEAMRQVYLRGLALGNDPHHFAKVGDCQNVSSLFLSIFDHPGYYNLGADYAGLQETIDWFNGSFERESLAVKGGFNGAALLSPLRADPELCQKGEHPLACEYRLHRPSVAIISLETWWSKKPVETYEFYMRQVIEYSLENGIVPILVTKADNLEGDYSINAAIARLAVEYEIPLWNFWKAVQVLPDHGLMEDGFHLTFAGNDFDNEQKMQNAWPVRNLTALQSLDAVWRGLNPH